MDTQKLSKEEVHLVLDELNLLPKNKRINGKGFYIEKLVCIFHNESEGSLSIHAETGKFLCFGCNERGNIFDLHAQINRISSRESFRLLMERFGKMHQNNETEEVQLHYVRIRNRPVPPTEQTFFNESAGQNNNTSDL